MLVAAVHSPPRKSPGELPANGASLLAEAKRNYAAGDLNKAEASYQQLVSLESTNIGALADLASIEVDLKHTEDAEKNIKAALAIDPNHEYSLFVLGRVKFQEEKYDDALDAFSRAAQANPKSAEIQNYLGITLSEKGLRVPAEAALRRAVQLDPKYGSAHANLAFIYITQKPPIVPLAKWHYEKAVASGQPRNPDMEKRLAAAADSAH
jgi:Flp pilus assembly protein TadD